MALELKGLKANMMKLHKRIDTLNQLASAGDTKGGELEKALTDVGTQLAGHLDDLNFAATMLGNGSGHGSESQPAPPVSQNAPAATTLAEPQQNAPAPVPETLRAIPRMDPPPLPQGS